MSNNLQDVITFQLRADKVVVNDTVKVGVTVNALVASDTTEEALRASVKEALVKFIADANWQFNGINRYTDDSGFERVILSTTARVSERENYNLEARARQVSVPGLQLAHVTVDTSIPAHKLEDAEKQLRADIINKAKEELAEVVELTGRKYRLGRIEFANQGDPTMRKSAALNSVQSYGATMALEAAGGADTTLANAQKVVLAANITLSVHSEWA